MLWECSFVSEHIYKIFNLFERRESTFSTCILRQAFALDFNSDVMVTILAVATTVLTLLATTMVKLFINDSVYTHTHTHIYIYIYQERDGCRIWKRI